MAVSVAIGEQAAQAHLEGPANTGPQDSRSGLPGHTPPRAGWQEEALEPCVPAGRSAGVEQGRDGEVCASRIRPEAAGKFVK